MVEQGDRRLGLKARLGREVRYLKGLRRTLARVRSVAADSPRLCCDDLEEAVDRFRANRALSCDGRTLTYGEFDALANRFAHWARTQGVKRGQTVAVCLPNRLEYVPPWYGLTKLGVVAALANNQLTGAALAHCVDLAAASLVVVDADTAPALIEVRGLLARPVTVWTLGEVGEGLRDLPQALKSCSSLRPDRSGREELTAKDTALLIYTSGTTGLPKAARVTHMRVQLYMRGFAGATGAGPGDSIYDVLPLYHATGGLCAVGAALLTGARLVVRRRFSASRFWPDMAEEGCTLFVYIGELGRYLVNAPVEPDAPARPAPKLRCAFGNGLREEVWVELQRRFGVPEVLEFYGSTEGNVSTFNFDGRPGAVGRVPRYLRSRSNFRLIRFDVETEQPVRGADGLCVECRPGEVGECVGQIGADARSSYAGYADRAATEKKVLTGVMARGDRWFRTGDLLRQDREGYFYFVDRIGDTFRWKGENVSTSEVAARLAEAPGVAEAIVYGVEVAGMDGRAGMAALHVEDGFDLHALQAAAVRDLPAYAQPLFIRLKTQFDTTGTFKYRKLDLVEQGFDPARTDDPLFFRDPAAGFVPLTPELRERIVSGDVRV